MHDTEAVQMKRQPLSVSTGTAIDKTYLSGLMEHKFKII